MTDKKIDLANFDFGQFQKEAIDKLKSGQSLAGKDGILTPLIKAIIEAALEGEMDAHLSECKVILPARTPLGGIHYGKSGYLITMDAIVELE